MFADDTSLSYSSSNINEIEQRLNSDMIKIYNWSTKWLVDFNPQKTKCMLFSTNQGNIKPQILLPKFASIESLYFETKWEPLHSRRHSRKLNLFYKIRNNDSPLYLYDCLLPFTREEN